MSFSSGSHTLNSNDFSGDNSDDYEPSDTTYNRRHNKRSTPGGDRYGEGKADSEAKKSHHASCHRCGNIRKKYIYCERCPQVFCMKCQDKMIEEYGPNCFKNGCPVCLKLCCCSEKSLNCTRKYHCYKKCLTTKKGIKKATNYRPPPATNAIHSQSIASEVTPLQKAPVHPSNQPPIHPSMQQSLQQVAQQPMQQPMPQSQSVPQSIPLAMTPSVQSNMQASYQPSVQGPVKMQPQSMSIPPLQQMSVRSDSSQSNPVIPLFPTYSGLQSVPSMYSHADMPFAMNSLMSFPSTPYPLSRMNSDLGADTFGGTLTPRMSRHVPAMGWDPSLCQLQRAPDSINVLNGSLYEPQGAMQPLILPLQRVSSHQAELVRRTSLLSRNSQQKSPLSDGTSQVDTAWVVTTPPTILSPSVPSVRSNTSMPMDKPEGITSEVCFGDYSDTETERKPQRPLVRSVDTVEPSQPVLPRVLSRHEGEGGWMNMDVLKSVAVPFKGEGTM